ncbi:unnamed protein product [Rangifer tarandus platyrhynchus]|uniref:Uncharacterized protein n=1 Tax=Rangifer tarandus platyrhynchus TaxID=3082113 RepID=A0ABN8ZWN8_RANTA|nr:unnamed protein product [Rangifer tarandus platyrhynchus]
MVRWGDVRRSQVGAPRLDGPVLIPATPTIASQAHRDVDGDLCWQSRGCTPRSPCRGGGLARVGAGQPPPACTARGLVEGRQQAGA